MDRVERAQQQSTMIQKPVSCNSVSSKGKGLGTVAVVAMVSLAIAAGIFFKYHDLSLPIRLLAASATPVMMIAGTTAGVASAWLYNASRGSPNAQEGPMDLDALEAQLRPSLELTRKISQAKDSQAFLEAMREALPYKKTVKLSTRQLQTVFGEELSFRQDLLRLDVVIAGQPIATLTDRDDLSEDDLFMQVSSAYEEALKTSGANENQIALSKRIVNQAIFQPALSAIQLGFMEHQAVRMVARDSNHGPKEWQISPSPGSGLIYSGSKLFDIYDTTSMRCVGHIQSTMTINEATGEVTLELSALTEQPMDPRLNDQFFKTDLQEAQSVGEYQRRLEAIKTPTTFSFPFDEHRHPADGEFKRFANDVEGFEFKVQGGAGSFDTVLDFDGMNETEVREAIKKAINGTDEEVEQIIRVAQQGPLVNTVTPANESRYRSANVTIDLTDGRTKGSGFTPTIAISRSVDGGLIIEESSTLYLNAVITNELGQRQDERLGIVKGSVTLDLTQNRATVILDPPQLAK